MEERRFRGPVDLSLKGPVSSLGLRARATLAWGIIALVLSAALATFAYQVTRDQLVEERQQNAVTQGYLNARLVRNTLMAGEPQLSEALSAVGGSAQSVVLARVGGEWFSGSVGIGPNSLPSSLAEVVASGRAARQLVEVDGEPYVWIGVAIPAFNARYFELVPMDDIERTLDGLARGLALSALVATLAGAAIGWLASGRILKPLRQFTSAAESIAEGSFDTRIQTTDDRDLRVLARSFNRMADAVQQRIDRESRFTSQVSHELRSPVAALFSAINVARRRATKGTTETLDDMERRVADLHRLVEDLLELSRVEAGVSGMQIEPVDPAQLARGQLERMGKSTVPVEVDGDVPKTLQADKRRLSQMLQNLIDNADRYGGGVERVHISGMDGKVCFAVEDHGPGVAEHERHFIFERFARGETAATSGHSGAGLGLALVTEHAVLHGGRVRLE
ncbi:MAG TPA: HAMP domain-containing sensor histidine kinase, partial [Actinomycetota bacterium]|nr:HAMP domain-containing sensor histidine kinase [Actinomycetota bacterium]